MAGGMIGPGNGRKRYRPMAEINVTPMVDVMLVLLIIFMVTAPMITSGVNVNLPQANAKPVNSDATPITITVNAQNQIYLQNSQVQLANLVATLQQISQNNTDRRVFVRGDKDVSYGDMLQVMATITQGGFTKVALLAQQPTTGK
ncbi:MAG TPA: protein TolR [Acidocella sp.]|nr:MAG: protein TolR [Acidocella sp. 20-61-6]HQT46738.1 protein TolR [Acidocella sp.]